MGKKLWIFLLLITSMFLSMSSFFCSLSLDYGTAPEYNLTPEDSADVAYHSAYLSQAETEIRAYQIDVDKARGVINCVHDFLDWMIDEQWLIYRSDIPNGMPGRYDPIPTTIDAAWMYIYCIDPNYIGPPGPVSHYAFNPAGRRISNRIEVNLMQIGWLDSLTYIFSEGWKDIYARVSFSQSDEISVADVATDSADALFTVAHEIFHGHPILYCIEEPVGIILPCFIIEKFAKERGLANIEHALKQKRLQYLGVARSWNDLYNKARRDGADYITIISEYYQWYLNNQANNPTLSLKIFYLTLKPATDYKLGWATILASYPYYRFYEDVFNVLKEAYESNGYDAIELWRRYQNVPSITTREKYEYNEGDGKAEKWIEILRKTLIAP